ncbi:MAG: 30S ribosomal protein S16 [Chitinophagales bacterium]
MPVKIRLQRYGRKQRPYYHIVVADSRNKRDGKFIERIGDYNPLTVPATINLDVDKAFQWVMNGAQPTDTVRKVLTFKGVLYKKHLQRGVQKGALTQEEADKKFEDWETAKLAKIQSRIDKEVQKIEEKRTKRNEHEATKRSAKMVATEAAAEEVVEEESAAEATEEVVENEVENTTEDTASEETQSEEKTEE